MAGAEPIQNRSQELLADPPSSSTSCTAFLRLPYNAPLNNIFNHLVNCIFLFFIVFIYLTELDSVTERSSFHCFTPKWLLRLLLCGSEARSQVLPPCLPGLPCGCRGPCSWGILHCPPGPQKRAGLEEEQLGLYPAPIQVASTAGGGLTK